MGINRNFDDDLPPQPVPVDRIMIEDFVNPLDGSIEMAVNGAITPVSFRAPIPTGLGITGLVLDAHFYLCDTAIRPSRFAGQAALTNGCKLSFRTVANAVIPLGGQVEVSAIGEDTAYKTNADWITAVGTSFEYWDGGANDHLFAWDFPIHEWGISIELKEGEYLEMLIRDDLSAIDSFQGAIVCRFVGDGS